MTGLDQIRLIAALLVFQVAFGALTLFSGGQILFAPAVIAGATLLVFLAMGIYVIQFDGLYNAKTVGAMALRCSVWLLIAVLARGYWQEFKATKTG